MKNFKLILPLILVSLTNAFAQMPDFSKQVHEAMSKISVMEGKWEGKSWIERNGEKKNSSVTENIQWKLDKTLLLIEGTGKNDEGIVVHNALGLLSYNFMNKNYSMNSFLSNGLSTNASFEVIEPNKKFKWWFDDNRGGTIRYTITINENNWKEEGEYSRDNENWNKFFEMNLVKTENQE